MSDDQFRQLMVAIGELNTEIKEVRNELKQEIQELRTELKKDIEKVNYSIEFFREKYLELGEEVFILNKKLQAK
jgi:septal ring factor EnvC (AmiA/AmiB activator)